MFFSCHVHYSVLIFYLSPWIFPPIYRIYPLDTPSILYPPLHPYYIPVYSPYISNTPLCTEYTPWILPLKCIPFTYPISPYIPHIYQIHPLNYFPYIPNTPLYTEYNPIYRILPLYFTLTPPTCRRYRYVFPPPTKYTLTYQTYALCMRNSPPTYRIHPNMPWNGSQTRPKESYAANKNEWGADKAFTELRPLFLTFSCPVSILVELVNLARQDGHLVSISAHRSRQWRQNMCPCPHTK